MTDAQASTATPAAKHTDRHKPACGQIGHPASCRGSSSARQGRPHSRHRRRRHGPSLYLESVFRQPELARQHRCAQRTHRRGRFRRSPKDQRQNSRNHRPRRRFRHRRPGDRSSRRRSDPRPGASRPRRVARRTSQSAVRQRTNQRSAGAVARKSITNQPIDNRCRRPRSPGSGGPDRQQRPTSRSSKRRSSSPNSIAMPT